MLIFLPIYAKWVDIWYFYTMYNFYKNWARNSRNFVFIKFTIKGLTSKAASTSWTSLTLHQESSGLILCANLRICSMWFLPAWLCAVNLKEQSENSHAICSAVSFSMSFRETYNLTNLELSSHPGKQHYIFNWIQLEIKKNNNCINTNSLLILNISHGKKFSKGV